MPMDSSGGPDMGTGDDDYKAPKPMNTVRAAPTKFGFDGASIKRNSPRGLQSSKADYLANRDPMQEFFQLTCKSIILNSPHMNTICTVSQDQLYRRAIKEDVPFFKWATWIDDYLNKEFLRLIIRNSKS